MFLALMFFIADFTVCSIFSSFHSYLLVAYLIFESTREIVDNLVAAECIFLLILQSCLIDKIVGINLIYSVLVVVGGSLIRKNIREPPIFALRVVLITLVICLDCFLIKKVVFHQNLLLRSTFIKIFVNIVLVVLISYLLGFWGNRPRDRIIRGRKVWTPNKMDAL